MVRKVVFFLLAGAILMAGAVFFRIERPSLHLTVYPPNARVLLNGKEIAGDRDLFLPWFSQELTLQVQADGYKPQEMLYRPHLFGPSQLSITLEPQTFPVTIDLEEGNSTVFWQNKSLGTTPLSTELPAGLQEIRLVRQGYTDEWCRLDVQGPGHFHLRHHPEGTPFKQIGIFPCGSQPKQVVFSPDEQKLCIPLLDEECFDVLDIADALHGKPHIERITPPDPQKQRGYVEALFIEESDSPATEQGKETGTILFWISQMTTGRMYEYRYPDFIYQRSIPTGGSWSKFMAWSAPKQVVAVSNWLSDTVSIIDIPTGTVQTRLATDPVPRGLAFSSDGSFLLVTTYDGGTFIQFDTTKWKPIQRIKLAGSNLRHVVLSPDNRWAYVSDMAKNRVYQIRVASFSIEKIFMVDHNPNTIDLSPDGKWLFVSCRGPNNPESYLLRSPRSGRIAVINLEDGKIVHEFSAGNQPTGLDVSPSGSYLALSNFLDNTIELFWIRDFLEPLSKGADSPPGLSAGPSPETKLP
ncbi:MAG: beta-propeller fold lactonase family protein [Treponemataceae bacterium]|nr:beta-propeller fold lactonase family protein [Treponemataceae bacterium]